MKPKHILLVHPNEDIANQLDGSTTGGCQEQSTQRMIDRARNLEDARTRMV